MHPDHCQLCDKPLSPGDGRWTTIRRAEHISRSSLDQPTRAHLAYRTRSHAVFDEPAFLCEACAADRDDEQVEHDGRLRRATLKLGLVMLTLIVVGCGYAILRPGTGPDLWRAVFPDPDARPMPAASYAPYKPPF